jgi:transposase
LNETRLAHTLAAEVISAHLDTGRFHHKGRLTSSIACMGREIQIFRYRNRWAHFEYLPAYAPELNPAEMV